MSLDRSVQLNEISPVKKITLMNPPLKMNDCFDLLRKAGAEYFTLFGGAVRDTEYTARNRLSRMIKDYDIRVWLSDKEYETNLMNFIMKLKMLIGAPLNKLLCEGTQNFHYSCIYKEIELDISVRAVNFAEQSKVSLSKIAIDIVANCDVAISAVAIDSTGQAWARPEFLEDLTHKTLTIYPLHGAQRQLAYSTRMQKKFPFHKLKTYGSEFSFYRMFAVKEQAYVNSETQSFKKE